MKKKIPFVRIIFIILVFFYLNSYNVYSQLGVSINKDGTPADPSAMLDVSSTNQGMLLPQMTTSQRDAIVSPATGLLIYNLTTNFLIIILAAVAGIR